jgi:Small-conductance mechanosensitive channel
MVFFQTIFPIDTIPSPPVKDNLSFGQLIKGGNYESLLDNVVTWSIDLAVNILIAIVLFIVGRFLISKIDGFVKRIMRKSTFDTVLKGFLHSILRALLFAVLFMIIINAVGVTTVSIAAIIATAGLAVGLAMKDNLANFAGGVMILLSKPFRGGDFITAQNLEGTVETIGILHTILRTVDNKTIYIPNGPLSTGNIINNNSLNGTLRTDIMVNVGYGSKVEEVKELLLTIADQHPRVLKKPAPFARMIKLNPTSIEFSFRVWAKKNDLAEVTNDMNEAVYVKLYERGFITPFQEMKVLLAKEEQGSPNTPN